MKFKDTLSSEDHLEPARRDGFVPIDQIVDSALSPDEVLMAKEEGETGFDHPVAKDSGLDRYPNEDDFGADHEGGDDYVSERAQGGPTDENIPEVPTHLEGRVSDHLATQHIREAADREIDADIWGGDKQTHVDKKFRPKGADTIRGTDWTPVGDDASVEKMDEAA